MTEIAFSFPLADGMHARPASRLQEICSRLDARVAFFNRRSRRRAAAGSVLELVATATLGGDPCLLRVSGPREREAARALRAFLREELPRVDDAQPAPADGPAGTAWLPPVFRGGPADLSRGRPLAPGSGRAPVLLLRRRRRPAAPAAGPVSPSHEQRRFQAALNGVQEEMGRRAAGAAGTLGGEILKAQLALLSDPHLRQRVLKALAAGRKRAEAAVEEAVAATALELRALPSAYLRERAGDLEEIADLLVGRLSGRPPAPARAAGPRALAGPRVVVAERLAPAELLAMERRCLRGLVLGEVGPTAHVAILARSLGLPAVSLPLAALSRLRDGEEVIVDGRRGLVARTPGAGLKRRYRQEEAARIRRLRRSAAAKGPARTRDGARLELAANAGSAAELESAWRLGAEGVGLFRSEMLFLDRESPPGEDEQLDAYARALRSARNRPVTIRTLDVGGDKPLPYLPLPREENPFLGRRSVRFYGEHADLVRCQLRALLRAGRRGRLKVMVPMVAAVTEVRLVRRLLADAAGELRARRVPHAPSLELGIMVETPAAALSLDLLASEADFFSVGSNDLLQYVMAVDRGSDSLADLYDPLQPAFLRLLAQAAGQARRAGRRLALCGEMAGDPALLPLLVGLGFDGLSMAPARIPAVRERLAQLDGGECRDLLRRVLDCADAGAAARQLAEFNDRGIDAGVVDAGLVRLASGSRSAGEAIQELCGLLELEGRVSDPALLEEAVWRREETYATDLGLGFALPHARSAAVRASSIAFLRPRRPFRWRPDGTPVRGVLLIAIPERQASEEHLKLIARLSRRLMHEEFRAALLAAPGAGAVLAALRSALEGG